jgi:predicted nuclease of restriction endonuclease-like (RecB) superfamily
MVIAGQKRIRVDDEDFYIELLLYHRKLRRLVAVDLKLEKEFPFRKLEPRF